MEDVKHFKVSTWAKATKLWMCRTSFHGRTIVIDTPDTTLHGTHASKSAACMDGHPPTTIPTVDTSTKAAKDVLHSSEVAIKIQFWILANESAAFVTAIAGSRLGSSSIDPGNHQQGYRAWWAST
jgi:hypothetical protein